MCENNNNMPSINVQAKVTPMFVIMVKNEIYINGAYDSSESFILYDRVFKSEKDVLRFLASFFMNNGYESFLDEKDNFLNTEPKVWIIEGKPYFKTKTKIRRDVTNFSVVKVNCIE